VVHTSSNFGERQVSSSFEPLLPQPDSAISPDQIRSRYIERVIDQRLHPLDEVHGMWQGRVILERSLVCPS
jgi:hypothetical protein